jgi:hypothetical protein
MKQIAALLLATVSLLTFTNASAADRWGWSDLEAPQLLPTASEDAWVPVGLLGSHVGNGGTRVKVVPLAVEAISTKAPGSLSAAFPQLDEALEAIRLVVAEDPALSTNLKARGFDPDDVIGLTHGPSGEVTLFVGELT